MLARESTRIRTKPGQTKSLSFVVLASRFAVADIFWRSGQTNSAAAAESGRVPQHHRRARLTGSPGHWIRHAPVRSRPLRNDPGDPALFAFCRFKAYALRAREPAWSPIQRITGLLRPPQLGRRLNGDFGGPPICKASHCVDARALSDSKFIGNSALDRGDAF